MYNKGFIYSLKELFKRPEHSWLYVTTTMLLPYVIVQPQNKNDTIVNFYSKRNGSKFNIILLQCFN